MTGPMDHRADVDRHATQEKPAPKATSRAGHAGPVRDVSYSGAESYHLLLVAATCRSWRPVSVALLTTRMR